jgi:RNA polymerase sigma-70 factor (ECF subfamily)
VTKTAPRRHYLDVSDGPPATIAAFDEIYNLEFDYVWRTLGRLGVRTADLDDATHDVFVVLYRRWADVDPTQSLRTWLFGVARRIAAHRRRKPDEIAEPVDRAAPTDNGLADRDLLWKALARLDDDRREVVVLHDLEGRTGAEIATLLDIPVNTVHSRLRLARADLAAAVERLEGKP